MKIRMVRDVPKPSTNSVLLMRFGTSRVHKVRRTAECFCVARDDTLKTATTPPASLTQATPTTPPRKQRNYKSSPQHRTAYDPCDDPGNILYMLYIEDLIAHLAPEHASDMD